jgi:hypothetical protein
MDLNSLLVGSIPLVVIIFGLVEFIKSMGLTGRILTVLSMIVGILLGLGYHVAINGIPAGFSGWFIAVCFGLAMGLVASGFYNFANDRFPKVSETFPNLGSRMGLK